MADGGEQQSQQGGLNLGFKIQGRARTKVAVNVKVQREDRQLITGVAGSVIQAAERSANERRQHVIPRLENTYKTGVGKFVPTFVPESSSAPITGKADDRYEKAAKPDVPGLTSYGLQLRQPKSSQAAAADGAAADEDGAAADEDGAAADAAGAAGSGPLVPLRRGDEVQQLKDDLEALPDEASVEDYEAMPVEEFGKALLRGLGWADGQGVGRKRQLVEPKQTIRRPDRLGLGANPAAPPPDKRPRKMGDKPKQDLVAAPAADGSVRHRVGLDEVLVPRESLLPGPAVGKAMLLVAGRHEGLACVVKELRPPAEGSGPGRVLVELQPSHEVVEVAADELGEKGDRSRAAAAAANGSRPGKQQRESTREGSRDRDREQEKRREDSRDKERDRGKARDRDRERGSSGRDEEQRHRSSRDRRSCSRSRSREKDRGRQRRSSKDADGDGGSRQQQQQQQRRVLPPSQLWLAQLIRVRVIDKRLQGGKLYLKKGMVLDVAPDGSCELRMEDSRQVVSVHQDQLETVVPKEAGAAVMVVAGQHKGCKGRLLQVSMSSGAAALQLVGDMSVVRLLLDDVAQFMGHLEEEED